MIRLRKVIATRKATFQERNCRGQEYSGSKGGPISLIRTILRFQTGAGGTLGGMFNVFHKSFNNRDFEE